MKKTKESLETNSRITGSVEETKPNNREVQETSPVHEKE